ncbi:MAG: AAA family ATPase [Candidatus Aenigmatarchaeota archaeon]
MEREDSLTTGTLISYVCPSEMIVTTKNRVENIFQTFLKTESVFKNKTLISHTFIPTQILHRDREITTLSEILAPALRGFQPNNVFIYGTVGTGKTITAKFVLNELGRIAQKNKLKLKTIYINAKMKKVSDTEYRILAQILKELGVTVPETGISTNILYKKFFDRAAECSIILVLDEIDTLFNKIGDDFLYNITRGDAKITIVGITNNLKFHDLLDVRVRSSLSEEEIVFRPYDALQLRDILMTRMGAFNYTIDDDVINKCSAIAAQEHGDARRALELLRTSAEIAERQSDAVIVTHHVDLANEKINSDRVIDTVRGQPIQSQLILQAMIKLYERSKEKNNWADRRILGSDAFSVYKNSCDSRGLKPLTQRRVSDLINELEMLGIISTNIFSKGRYGRNREIRFQLDESMVTKIQRVFLERDL